jgi:aminodeoxyfutalosine deaminase
MQSVMLDFIRTMPKVELHVHLEGSIQPETLLLLAEKNQIDLPYTTVEGLREWFTFRDFPHFVEIYFTICDCLCTADDVENIAREFLRGQARQNVRYSEVIFTPYTHFDTKNSISFPDQLAALSRAREWALEELGVRANWVLDVSREVRPIEHSHTVTDWAISGLDAGVVGLGVGGPEVDNPPEMFEEAFRRARSAGLASLPHAGETAGPASVWGALKTLKADRIGHGVRCVEDPELVAYLRGTQVPLDVSPSSNVCLSVVPSIDRHPLPRMLEEGLFVTINSDDPALFNTTLTDEYQRITETFGFSAGEIQQLVLNAVHASCLPENERSRMEREFAAELVQLRQELEL